MTLQERFNPQALIAAACAEAGSDDFGDDGWQAGLDLVAEELGQRGAVVGDRRGNRPPRHDPRPEEPARA